MGDRKTKTLLSIAVIVVAFRSYTASGIKVSAAVTALTAWLLYNARNKEVLWKSLSHLKNPIASSIQFAAVGYVIAALLGLDFYSAGVFAAGAFFLGGFMGFVFNIYWNI